jgi:hypothetical protein
MEVLHWSGKITKTERSHSSKNIKKCLKKTVFAFKKYFAQYIAHCLESLEALWRQPAIIF